MEPGCRLGDSYPPLSVAGSCLTPTLPACAARVPDVAAGQTAAGRLAEWKPDEGKLAIQIRPPAKPRSPAREIAIPHPRKHDQPAHPKHGREYGGHDLRSRHKSRVSRSMESAPRA